MLCNENNPERKKQISTIFQTVPCFLVQKATVLLNKVL